MLKIKINEGTFDEINYNTDENVYSKKKNLLKIIYYFDKQNFKEN